MGDELGSSEGGGSNLASLLFTGGSSPKGRKHFEASSELR